MTPSLRFALLSHFIVGKTWTWRQLVAALSGPELWITRWRPGWLISKSHLRRASNSFPRSRSNLDSPLAIPPSIIRTTSVKSNHNKSRRGKLSQDLKYSSSKRATLISLVRISCLYRFLPENAKLCLNAAQKLGCLLARLCCVKRWSLSLEDCYKRETVCFNLILTWRQVEQE